MGHHIIPGEIQTIEGIEHVNQGLESFGLKHGKGNEKAHTGGVSRRL